MWLLKATAKSVEPYTTIPLDKATVSYCYHTLKFLCKVPSGSSSESGLVSSSLNEPAPSQTIGKGLSGTVSSGLISNEAYSAIS